MNQNNFNNINDPLLQSPFQNPNSVININDILNYVNNLQDLELILNPPYQLSLSLDSLLLPARRNRKNKINKIPRPQNAWVLFRKDYEANKRIQFPDQLFKMKTVSINAGDEWKIQSYQVKRYFEILSKLALAKHKIIYPDYKYTPKKRSNSNKDWVFHNTLVLGEDNQINKINQDDNSYEFSTIATSPIASRNTFTEFNNEFSEVDTSHQPGYYYNDSNGRNDHHLQFTPHVMSVDINDIHDNSNNNNNNNNNIHDNNDINSSDIHVSNDISNDIYINDNNINENIYNINNNTIETPFMSTFISETSFTGFNNIDMNLYYEMAASMNSMNSMNSLNYSESMTVTPTLLADTIPEPNM
ncbi:hypothetical protein Glove_41g84 [Diversispora epigaea]|uniref:HMG box domain-containing protein n=1 Tax=Diversispora epigaea TaxID=1348612 RepID=A0A397JQ31_9GLOM|nr:hypothetical protein Glove_41g84 [Diversispora epigaea]